MYRNLISDYSCGSKLLLTASIMFLVYRWQWGWQSQPNHITGLFSYEKAALLQVLRVWHRVVIIVVGPVARPGLQPPWYSASLNTHCTRQLYKALVTVWLFSPDFIYTRSPLAKSFLHTSTLGVRLLFFFFFLFLSTPFFLNKIFRRYRLPPPPAPGFNAPSIFVCVF